MSALCIRNHDIAKLVLRYEPDTGAHTELEDTKLDTEAQLARGFYVAADGHFIGVYASTQGPVCFCDGKRFNLAESGYQAKVTKLDKENEFLLQKDGSTLVRVRYVPKTGIGNPFWPDDEEEFNDFFVWLEKNLYDPQFLSYYTVPA